MVFLKAPVRLMEALRGKHLRGPTTQIVEVDENGDFLAWEWPSGTFMSVFKAFRQELVMFLKTRHGYLGWERTMI